MRLSTIFLALASTHCGVFYEDSTSRSVVTYGHDIRRYDETLPEAMEVLIWECSTPLVLEEGITEINLLETCTEDFFTPGTGPNALYNLLSLGLPELAEPLTLSRVSETIEPEFSLWGYGCSVEVTPIVTVDRIALYHMQAEWDTRDGVPAMHVNFDFDEGIEAEVSFDYELVQCNPSGLNRYGNWLVSRVFGTPHTVTLPDPDLDLWLTLSRTSDGVGWSPSGPLMRIDADVEAEMTLGDIETDTLFDTLPDDLQEAVLETAGFDANVHESTIEGNLEDALVGLETTTEAYFDAELEAICDIDISGGDLVITSDEDCRSDARTSGASRYKSRWSR